MSQEKLDAIYDKVVRIEGALYPDANTNSPSRITVLEGRVGALESWKTYLAGAWAVVVAAVSYLVSHRK